MHTIILFGFLAGLDNLQIVPALGLMQTSVRRRWWTALTFGLCETLMPLVGLGLGQVLDQRLLGLSDHSSSVILAICGGVVVWLAWREADTTRVMHNGWVMSGIACVLGLDNLVAGIGLGVVGYPILVSALLIGLISGAMCAGGLVFGQWVRRWLPAEVEMISGAYLVVLAIIQIVHVDV